MHVNWRLEVGCLRWNTILTILPSTCWVHLKWVNMTSFVAYLHVGALSMFFYIFLSFFFFFCKSRSIKFCAAEWIMEVVCVEGRLRSAKAHPPPSPKWLKCCHILSNFILISLCKVGYIIPFLQKHLLHLDALNHALRMYSLSHSSRRLPKPSLAKTFPHVTIPGNIICT